MSNILVVGLLLVILLILVAVFCPELMLYGMLGRSIVVVVFFSGSVG